MSVSRMFAFTCNKKAEGCHSQSEPVIADKLPQAWAEVKKLGWHIRVKYMGNLHFCPSCWDRMHPPAVPAKPQKTMICPKCGTPGHYTKKFVKVCTQYGKEQRRMWTCGECESNYVIINGQDREV